MNYQTGKREVPQADPPYRMVATGRQNPNTNAAPPSRNGLIGVGILAVGAIGMMARKIRGGGLE